MIASTLIILCLAFGLGQSVCAEEYGFGDIPLDPETYQQYLRELPGGFLEDLPTSYDARNEGIVTPEKQQGL